MARRYGTQTNAIEASPRYRAKQARRRRREEDRWAALAGPVEVRRVETAGETCQTPPEGAERRVAHQVPLAGSAEA